MKKIKVAIDDGDGYFNFGLQHSILEYATGNNKSVIFLTRQDGERPDVAFVSSLRRAGRWRSHAGKIVTIQERPFPPAACTTDWVLNRSASQQELFALLGNIFAHAGEFPHRPTLPLTQREKQVVSYLRCGLDQSQTARILGVSVKTIHSHKRSVMGKLLLNRNHDFIYWLLAEKQEHS